MRERRDAWVLPLAMLASAAIHVVVLVMPISPASPAGAGRSVAGPGQGLDSEMKLVGIVPPPGLPTTTEARTAETAPLERPVPIEAAVPATAPRARERAAPTRPRLSPADSDARLWAFTAPGPHLRDQRLPAESQLDSAIHRARQGGINVVGLRITMPSCDSYLTCQLDFQRGSRLAEVFDRAREIEQQGALQALYKQRREAMNVRRKRTDR